MYRRVTVDELKKNVDEVIERVTEGDYITIYRDGKPIASISRAWIPRVEGPAVPHPLQDIDFGAPPAGLTVDAAESLIDERDRDRTGEKYR